MNIALDQVDKHLAHLWDGATRHDQATARTTLLTLVIIVSEDSLLERVEGVIAEVIEAQPVRTIVVRWTASGESEIIADAALHLNSSKQPSGDSISLLAKAKARHWLPENIDRFVLSGMPCCVWWVGDLPDRDDLFERMVERADITIINSAEMDLRDLNKVADIADKFRHTAIADLTWGRLRGMQDLIARFFDHPDAAPYLDELTRITLAFSPRENDIDVASTRVGLLLGWICHALNLDTQHPRWYLKKGFAQVVLRRRGGNYPEVTVHIERERRPGVHDGALTRVELAAGTDEEAVFTVARQEDPSNVQWTAKVPDGSRGCP
jgi:glucose-6-phosphate dehydrogenase assembly protein OpcA